MMNRIAFLFFFVLNNNRFLTISTSSKPGYFPYPDLVIHLRDGLLEGDGVVS